MTRRRLGLRGRLVGALVLSSVATLAFVAVGILGPLAGRLRHEDELALIHRAHDLGPAFAALPPSELRADAGAIDNLADELHRRTAARVVVLVGGRPVADSDAKRTGAGPPNELPPNGLVVDVPTIIAGRPGTLRLLRDAGDVAIAVRVVRTGLLGAGLIGLLLAAVVGVFAAQRLLRRLDALRAAALRVAAGGPAGPLPDARTHDEVGDVSRAFATMQHAIERQEAARQDFVATASHELRTPLASLGVILELAADDLGEDDGSRSAEARRQVELAREQVERLSGLARDLLDLSRLDAGVDLRGERLELSALARAVAAEFKLPAGGGPEVVAGPPVWAWGDPGAVAQVVRGLVDNALRHAGPSPRIVLDVLRPDRDTAALMVGDDGPGIGADEAEHVFERFARGAGHAQRSGFGLGLAIGRELARRMGGDLRLLDGGPGARFVLSLPRAVPAPSSETESGAQEAPEVPARASAS
jgi:signal transduction histidine kinase